MMPQAQESRSAAGGWRNTSSVQLFARATFVKVTSVEKSVVCCARTPCTVHREHARASPTLSPKYSWALEPSPRSYRESSWTVDCCAAGSTVLLVWSVPETSPLRACLPASPTRRVSSCTSGTVVCLTCGRVKGCVQIRFS